MIRFSLTPSLPLDRQDEFDEIDMFAYGVGANTSFAPYWAGMKKFLSGGGDGE